MPTVRKVNPDWFPRENPDLEVGDTIEMSDAEVLLREGHVELVEAAPKTKAPAKKEEAKGEDEAPEAPKKKPAAKK